MSASLCPVSLPPHCFPGLQWHAHPPFFLCLLSSSAITHLFPGPTPAVLTLGKSPSVSALGCSRGWIIPSGNACFASCSARLLFPPLPYWPA